MKLCVVVVFTCTSLKNQNETQYDRKLQNHHSFRKTSSVDSCDAEAKLIPLLPFFADHCGWINECGILGMLINLIMCTEGEGSMVRWSGKCVCVCVCRWVGGGCGFIEGAERLQKMNRSSGLSCWQAGPRLALIYSMCCHIVNALLIHLLLHTHRH